MAAETAEAQFQSAMAMLAADKHSPDWGQVAGLIDAAAHSGHAEAIERRALLECRGVHRPANWDKALDSLALAATSGSQFAARQLLLLADGRFEPADSVGSDGADWNEMRSRISLPKLMGPPATRGLMLSNSPIVHAIPGFASGAECQWLIALAEPQG